MPALIISTVHTSCFYNVLTGEEHVFFIGDLPFELFADLVFGTEASQKGQIAQEDPPTLVLSGEPPFVEVSGPLQPDGSFVATGVGTVAGFPNVSVEFQGTFRAGRLAGEYSMGDPLPTF